MKKLITQNLKNLNNKILPLSLRNKAACHKARPVLQGSTTNMSIRPTGKILLQLNFHKFIAICLFFISTLTLLKPTNCYSANSKNLLLQHKADLEAIENYLNNIKNFTARFVQKTENGAVEGRFYLSRPGKMRVEYINQPKILIIVNGSVLSYKDIELDEISNLSTNSTPASLLTRNNISFSAKDVEITNITKSEDFIIISLLKKNRTEAGEFSLVFKNNPLGFVRMEIKNDLGEKTIISLKDPAFPESLDDSLFVIKNKNLPF